MACVEAQRHPVWLKQHVGQSSQSEWMEIGECLRRVKTDQINSQALRSQAGKSLALLDIKQNSFLSSYSFQTYKNWLSYWLKFYKKKTLQHLRKYWKETKVFIIFVCLVNILKGVMI